jgi:hypothetical protein
MGRTALSRGALALAIVGPLLVGGCTGSAALPTCAPGGASACSRVLFLGNSYTYVNDLPGTFAGLAQSGGRQVEVAMVANGGETLSDHEASPDSTGKIAAEDWNYVVLQEQSEQGATDGGRDFMYGPGRALAEKAEAVGAVPMFFMTWAHEDGLPSAGLPDYDSMQRAVDAAYIQIAHELVVPVAPVGFVWYIVHHDHPDISLWQDDGSHPTQAGTYLAACVFYASVFRQSPSGLSFHGSLSDAQAKIMQDEAAEYVLGNLESDWGLR